MGPNEKQKIEIEKLHWAPLPPLNQAVTADYSDFLGTALIPKDQSLHPVSIQEVQLRVTVSVATTILGPRTVLIKILLDCFEIDRVARSSVDYHHDVPGRRVSRDTNFDDRFAPTGHKRGDSIESNST